MISVMGEDLNFVVKLQAVGFSASERRSAKCFLERGGERRESNRQDHRWRRDALPLKLRENVGGRSEGVEW